MRTFEEYKAEMFEDIELIYQGIDLKQYNDDFNMFGNQRYYHEILAELKSGTDMPLHIYEQLTDSQRFTITKYFRNLPCINEYFYKTNK